MGAESQLVDETENMECETLIPVEKRLIAWGFGLGFVLLGLLIWASYKIFSAAH